MSGGEVVSFADAYDRRHGPDTEHVTIDDRGVKWFRFTLAYKDGGLTFGFNIWALDHEDAERRLRLIAENGCVDGQVYSTIPY